MKIISILYFFVSVVYAKEVVCVVPENIKNVISPLFSQTIAYSRMKVKLQGVAFENTLQLLNRFKFSIVRRDILWQIQQDKNNIYKNKFITISGLPYKEQLFLIQKDTYLDFDMLSDQSISIGLLKDFNTFYIKALSEMYVMKYSLLYKSLSYKASMDALRKKKLSAYFSFLPTSVLFKDIHVQRLFRKEIIQYFDNLGIFEINYSGIYSPYVVIASLDASDEEIENMIYRLMEREIFSPITDRRFGPINPYVITQVENVKKVLQKNQIETPKVSFSVDMNSHCNQYHYGFLKLLREKPRIKKVLKQKYGLKNQKKYLKKMNTLLLTVDANQKTCDMHFLSDKRKQFFRLKEKIVNGF